MSQKLRKRESDHVAIDPEGLDRNSEYRFADVFMRKRIDSDIGMTNNRIVVESVACILRRLVDDGLISAEAARATMSDSLPTLADPALRILWEEATDAMAECSA